MATSEIEKLERRYAENPHGLTFAPLAEVHRKNGDVARALELLTAGLELHPNYIPASIVLGRCHQDLGDLVAAAAAFAHVLRLDDENVIALKSLADIDERLERLDEAEAWLRRLVSVDRSNEEAREQLHRLEALKNGRPASERAPVEASPPSGEASPAPEEPERPVTQAAAHDLPTIDIETLDLGKAESEPSPAPPSPPSAPDVPSITDRPEPLAPGPVEPMAGLISQEFEAPKEPVGTPGELLGIDVETSQEVVLEGSGGSEYRVPNAAEEFGEVVAAQSAAAQSAPAAPAASVAPAVPEAVPDPARRPSYVARDTQGESVAAFFRTMLAARPPGEGEPTRPPQDGLSLDSVFGKEAPAAPVSFDDFFGAKPEGSSAEQGPDPGNDDLDEFHTWLQNLKR